MDDESAAKIIAIAVELTKLYVEKARSNDGLIPSLKHKGIDEVFSHFANVCRAEFLLSKNNKQTE